MQHLLDGVESLHHAIHRAGPTRSPRRSTSRATSAPTTPRSTSSAAATSRRSPKTPEGVPHSTERFVRPSKDYSWSTIVDHLASSRPSASGSGEYRDVEYPHPAFMWCNFTLTDAAFHEGGPYSEIAEASVRDSDARVGEILDAVERAGVFDDTAFVLVADHGMQQTDPSVRGDWGVELREAGVQFRDEGYGFLYLGDT